MSNRVKQEIEMIEIPRELHQRSRLGIQQAKQEQKNGIKGKNLAATAAAITTGLLLVAALATAASPAFATFIKSLFLSSDVDEGLKNAAGQGFAEPIYKEVTDQGITLKVKEVVTDPYRVSVLFGVEKEGKALNASSLIYGGRATENREQDPFLMNKVEVLDASGSKLDRSFSSRSKSLGNDIMMYFSLDDIDDPSSPHEVANIPNQLVIDFDILQIGDTSGQWRLKVPIDLEAAKRSVNTISLNERYQSPWGFSIDFLQFRHGPSKSELLYRFNNQGVRNQNILISYEIKDSDEQVVASFDALTDIGHKSAGKPLQNINYLRDFSEGLGSTGYRKQWDAFLPLDQTDDLRLELKRIYTLDPTKDFSVTFDANEIMEKPLVKEYEGKTFTFTARMKTDEAKERFPDGHEEFPGTGWIIEVDQLLDAETVQYDWEIVDSGIGDAYETGEMTVPEMLTKRIGSRDENGNYHTRDWFFIHDKQTTSPHFTLHFNYYLKANEVNWSIPLESSSTPAPMAEKGFDATVSELDPAIVTKAKQAINELIPSQPVEIVGAYHWWNDNDVEEGAWLVYAADESRARIDKETGEILNVIRYLPYEKADAKIRAVAEQAIKELDPQLEHPFKRLERYQSVDVNRFDLSGNRAKVAIHPFTEQVIEASISYTDEQIESKAREAAEYAYSIMTDGQQLRLADGKLIKTPEEHIWKLESRAGSFRFQVGAKTNTLWSVSEQSKDDSPRDDTALKQAYAKPYYTREAAIAAVQPVVQNLFHIDLDGYELKVHLNEYTFVKSGQPTIKAKINRQGTFWEYQLLPGQGIRD